MKELSIEEKAKAYDEVLKKARMFYKDEHVDNKVNSLLEVLFPELKESEDERILKNLKAVVKAYDMWAERGLDMNDILAWLEKQGTSYTKRDVDDAYLKGVTDTKNEIEKQYEANYQIRKDIATFIFNYRGDIKDRAKWMDYLGIKVSFVEKQGKQKPADKVEPRFKAGDFVRSKYNKAVVLKIEEVCNDIYKTERGGYIRIEFQDDWELMEEKLAWSEEDEKILSDIIKDLVHPWNEYIPDRIEDEIKWLKNRLKSLKDRYTWKPSDEQMNTLEHYMHTLICNEHKEILFGLYSDLKKLKG